MKDHVDPVTLGFLFAAAVAAALWLFLGSEWEELIAKNREVSQPGPKKEVAPGDHADSDMR